MTKQLSNFTEKISEEPTPEILPVNLSTDAVTPLSRQPIPQVNKMAWTDMTSSDLQEQYGILENRYFTVISMGRPDIASQIQLGMEKLRKLIRQRIKQEAEEDPRSKKPGDSDVKAST